jgi:hypothetical protein
MTPSADLLASVLGWRAPASSPGWRAPVSLPRGRLTATSLQQGWRQRLSVDAEYLYFYLVKAYYDLLCLVAEGIYTVLRSK